MLASGRLLHSEYMAKRKTPDLFDNLEPAGSGDSGRDAASRSGLLSGGGPGSTADVPLHEAAQSRYLNYALSVITARARASARESSSRSFKDPAVS